MSTIPSDDRTSHTRRLVEAAREAWIKRLIDPSRGNALLFFRDLKVGMLELPHAGVAVAELLAGGRVDLAELRRALPNAKPEALARSLQTVRTKAVSNKEEKGVETLQLALGMAGWPALDGGKPYNAPVLLVPLAIESRGQGGLDLVLHVAGEPRLNPVLLHVLHEDYALEIDGEALVEACSTEDEEGDWAVDPTTLFQQLVAAARPNIAEFQVTPRALVANFHFARMSMVEDLRQHADQLAASPMIAAIAGDVDARQQLGRMDAAWEPRHDQRQPGEDYHVLLADSSQQAAIEVAEQGQSLVVQGPPGTGKSQTIANLIAQSVATGKRVLFVAEKRAALDAVIKRLSYKDVGLGHLVLDLHGAAVSRKQVMASLKLSLELVGASTPPKGADALHREFEERRRELNDHARRMNTALAPLGKSPLLILGALLRSPGGARTDLRLGAQAWTSLGAESLRALRATMEAVAMRPQLHLGTSSSPWNQARLATSSEAEQALATSRALLQEALPRLRRVLVAAAGDAGIAVPTTLVAALELAQVLEEAGRLHASLDPRVHDSDPDALVRALAPARKGWLGRTMAALFDGEYRRARKAMRALVRGAPRSAGEVLGLAEQAARHGARWRVLSPMGAPPAPSSSSAELLAAAEQVARECASLRALVPDLAPDAEPLEVLEAKLRALRDDAATAFEIPEVRRNQELLRSHGCGELLEELRAQAVPADLHVARFEHLVHSTALEAAYAAEPKLASFRGATHQDVVRRFRALDHERLQLAAKRVRRLHAESVIAAMNEHPDEAQLVRKEASKKARHKPLRKLLDEAPHVLTRLAPCWVASPLSVSQLLAASNDHFDLVVFDEGSQIPPEDAVPALYRARQVVAAGDQHQMPPTHFFATAVDADDMGADDADNALARRAEESIAGFESLLASLESFLPNRLLAWHYRSEDERLITYSNAEVYSKRLVTFPGARSHKAIEHVLVPHDPALGGQEGSASREVERVVELVLAHARTRPHESLGVITMGIKHANRVQAAIDKRVQELARTEPDLRAFFDLARDERFFVKNLETVQGDERDAIILTIGYGKDASGNLPLRFGPLLQDAGYRRLNVAITRAKRRMCVVSSFAAEELDLKKSGARGLSMLKGYLQYAQSGGERLAANERADEHELNEFECDIRDVLEARGLHLRAQYGASRFRIDLVAMHPQRLGQPILAIECDGASYHSSATARDRDRLRQHHLERLGWTFHRIWSTDWFRDREAELAALLRAYEEAIRRADLAHASALKPPNPPPPIHQDAPTPTPPVTPTIAHPTAPPAPQPAQVAESPSRTLPRPRLPHADSIDDYTRAHLVALLHWIASDGLLRTNEELMRVAREELGFEKMGSRIRRRLEEAVEAWRSSGR